MLVSVSAWHGSLGGVVPRRQQSHSPFGPSAQRQPKFQAATSSLRKNRAGGVRALANAHQCLVRHPPRCLAKGRNCMEGDVAKCARAVRIRQGQINLAQEAKAIRKLQKRAETRAKQVTADILEIGKRLAKVKAAIGHGRWTTWLQENFAMSVDTAQRYLAVARLSVINRNVRFLPLAIAYLLTRPGTPQEVIDDIIARGKRGETVSRRQVISVVRTVTPVRLRIPYYVSSPAQPTRIIRPVYTSSPEPSEPAEPEGSAHVARFAEALADFREKVTLPPPDVMQLAETVRAQMPTTSHADWRELGRALLALAMALEEMSGGDGDTEPPLPRPH
jgi:Protein of unknown function (DUF3102)